MLVWGGLFWGCACEMSIYSFPALFISLFFFLIKLFVQFLASGLPFLLGKWRVCVRNCSLEWVDWDVGARHFDFVVKSKTPIFLFS